MTSIIVLVDNDDDLPAVLANIRKAKARWGQVAALLVCEGASSQTMGYFYKAVVQAVLLYGAETWVLSSRMLQFLDSFHHRCARFISRCHLRLKPDGTWVTPRSTSVLQKCSLFTIAEYIRRRVATISDFIFERPIYRQCVQTRPSAAFNNQLTWW